MKSAPMASVSVRFHAALATKLSMITVACALVGVFSPALFCQQAGPVTCEVSSYLGGTGYDEADAVAVGSDGRAFLTGHTISSNFPVYSPTLSPYQSSRNGDYDIFVTALATGNTSLVYSTYLGGSGYDAPEDIAVDLDRDAYIVGTTLSSNFPVRNAYQASRKGTYDAFLVKLDCMGSSLEYSTYFGGNGEDYGGGVAVNGWRYPVIAGSTVSYNFPTRNAYQATLNNWDDAFVAMFNSDGSLLSSTYFGGWDYDCGVDVATDPIYGWTYVAGHTLSDDLPVSHPFQASKNGEYDCFVAKFELPGSQLLYSTYLGGSQDDSASGIAVDVNQQAVVVGTTKSASFPVASAVQPSFYPSVSDGFAAKLRSSGSALVFSTFWGADGEDSVADVAIDSAGDIFIAGVTDSHHFPVLNAYQTTSNGSNPPPNVNPQYEEGFVSGFTPSGSAALFSTYLGGTRWDVPHGVAVDSRMGVWVVGNTGSSNFPSINSYQRTKAGDSDAFFSLLRYDPSPRLTRVASGDYNGDSRSEPAYFNPRNGAWYVRGVINTIFGIAGDIPVSGDYNGDGTTEIAVFRPSTAEWRVRGIGNEIFGVTGDIPVPGDYDGDRTTEKAIFRPSDQRWAVQGEARQVFGRPGDIPIPGDYDNDGADEIAIYRPSDMYWAVPGLPRFNFGFPGSQPVPGDYFGDGRWEAAIYARTGEHAGYWSIRDYTGFVFGCPQEWPVPADYDGDEKDEPALFNAPAGLWTVPGLTRLKWGSTGVIPATR